MADRIRRMADFIRKEIAAGRVTSGAQCRPTIKARFPDATNADCLEVALSIADELAAGTVKTAAANDH